MPMFDRTAIDAVVANRSRGVIPYGYRDIPLGAECRRGESCPTRRTIIQAERGMAGHPPTVVLSDGTRHLADDFLINFEVCTDGRWHSAGVVS